MTVGPESEFGTGKCGHQKKKRGVSQVKVGHDSSHPFELVRRVNEGRRGSLVRVQMGCGFQDANRGGADRDKLIRFRDFFGKTSRDFVMFRVHGVLAKILCLDGAEGAEANVECDEGMGKLPQEFGSEVETGGGGGNRARGLGVGGLVVGGVRSLKIGLPLSFA